MRIIFMGTPRISVECLKYLLKSRHDIVAVVTKPDVIKGRGRKLVQVDTKKFAIDHNIPVITPSKLKDESFLLEIKKLKPDIIVVVAFQILPRVLFSIPRYGTVNLHGSLLPEYRGAAPINRAIMNGETETGITVFSINEKVDCGGILLKEKIDILRDDTAGDISAKMVKAGGPLLLKALDGIEDGSISPVCQENDQATKAPKIFPDDTNINWNRTDKEIHNLIRGLSPAPCSRTRFKGKIIKIYRSELSNTPSCGIPGSIEVKNKESMLVNTTKNQLSLLELQREGKTKLPVAEFLRGFNPGPDSKFENFE